jgi:dihydroflavonol-4-reductase
VIIMMEGGLPAIPRTGYEIVDVRCVADLHIRAMESEEAANQRFGGSAGYLSFQDMAEILRQEYPDRKIPRSMMPDMILKLFSRFDGSVKPLLVDLGAERKMDCSKAKELLDWEPIPPEEAVLATAQSAIDLDLV